MQLRPSNMGERRDMAVKPGAVIVVGVKLSSECREMLTWIIAKLAQPGDQVVAVHVVRAVSDSASADDILDAITKQKLDNTFESVLGVYQSICNLKQVRLDIKVVSGTSLRKSLVESAKMEKASKLVLGGTKHGCAESLAKYCLKRLPSCCLVLVVEHGQVVFGKEGVQSACGGTGKRSIKRFTSRVQNESSIMSVDDTSGDLKVSGPSKSDRSLNYQFQPSQQPGWPLMHSSITLEKVSAGRSLSVVRWALELPDRLKEAFDKQGGNVVRRIASSAMADRDNLPRLRPGTGKTRSNQVENSRQINELENGRNSVSSVLESPRQVSFVEKIDRLCRGKACVRFTHEELQEATSNFSISNLVGKGGCSKVYRGTLSDGQVVAVKCLKQGASEADEELLTEVEILTNLSHPQIVVLLGYCVDGKTHILVYSFASGGNLEENLHSGKDKPLLIWAARHKIAVGAAEALVYLHDTCPRPVVHRDVKSSNILLSSDFNPQISDFGLAKWSPTASTHITCSDVVGTLGYLAPEYFMFGRVNDKTDVYSFGVVLLELISGRPPIDMSKPKGQENLVAWARPFLDCGHIEKLVDPRLDGNYDENQLRNMVVAATFCLRQSPQYRPRMTRVLRMVCGEDNTCPSGRYDFTDEYLNEFTAEIESNDVRKHLALAMMGVDDDVASQSDQNSIDIQSEKNLDEYLGGRYSRSSSFD